ncbi:hypothetical protein NE237_010679 [Protea cynaroides]|uniref:Uncharacterized protein n=1 Tax=Protea cynaroides TaxID=273540 RepID=A0A9Q0L0U4_9MAGN|nr:hypothetical protein NE237_010679 [Protea cynaroides]
MLPSLKVEDEMKKDSHGMLDDDGNHTTSRIGYEVTNLGTTSLQQLTFPADNSVDKRESEKLQPPEHTESPCGKRNIEVPVNPQTISSTRISSEDMYMVLKHYGLALAEGRKNLPTEVYFGSVRLWPWEIIYYRRLKKGPISTDNYARRVSQNREFGIVDK